MAQDGCPSSQLLRTIFSPHPRDSEPYFGTFGHPNKLPASQDSSYVISPHNMVVYELRDMSLKTQCNVVNVSSKE